MNVEAKSITRSSALDLCFPVVGPVPFRAPAIQTSPQIRISRAAFASTKADLLLNISGRQAPMIAFDLDGPEFTPYMAVRS